MSELSKIPNLSELIELRNEVLNACNTIYELKECIDNKSSQYNVRSLYASALERLGYRKDECTQHIDAAFWQKIIEQSTVTNVMTERSKSEFLQKIEKKAPEFSKLEIGGFVQNITSIYGKSIDQTVHEVYSQLIGCRYSSGNWRIRKSDNLQKVEKCFRISGNIRFESYNKRFYFDGLTRYGFNFEDLLTVCRLLSGDGHAAWSETFEGLSDISFSKKQDIVETPYFTVKCYLNGNQKVTFTDNKILEMLNKYGPSGNKLPDIIKKKCK